MLTINGFRADPNIPLCPPSKGDFSDLSIREAPGLGTSMAIANCPENAGTRHLSLNENGPERKIRPGPFCLDTYSLMNFARSRVMMAAGRGM